MLDDDIVTPTDRCRQIPSGDQPIVVCERETLWAEIDRLRGLLAELLTDCENSGYAPSPRYAEALECVS